MPWSDAPLPPPLRAVDGAAIVRLAAAAEGHDVVGADELSEGGARGPWHAFADLMRDVADGATDLDDADRAVLAARLDAAIADLHAAGAHVVAGAAGGVLHVGVLPRGRARDPRCLFASD